MNIKLKILKKIWSENSKIEEVSRTKKKWQKKLAKFINEQNSNNDEKIKTEGRNHHFIENAIEVFFNAYIINQIIRNLKNTTNIVNNTNIVNIKNNNNNKFSAKSKRKLIHILTELGCAMACIFFEALIFHNIEHAIEYFSINKKILNSEQISLGNKIKNFWVRIGDAIAHPFKEKSLAVWIFLAILIISVILLHILVHKIIDLCFKGEIQQENTLDLLVKIFYPKKSDNKKSDNKKSDNKKNENKGYLGDYVDIYIKVYLENNPKIEINDEIQNEIYELVHSKLVTKFEEIIDKEQLDSDRLSKINEFIYDQLPKIIEKTIKTPQTLIDLSDIDKNNAGSSKK